MHHSDHCDRCNGPLELSIISHSTELRGAGCPRSAQASGGAALQGETPVACGDCPACRCPATRPRMLRATLLRAELVPVGAPRPQRLWAPPRLLAAWPGAPLPCEGGLGRVPPRAGPGPLGGGQDRLPARLLLRPPAPPPCALGRSRRGGAVVGPAPPPVAPRQPPPALARAGPGEPGVARGAPGLAPRRRARHPWGGPRLERGAATGAAAGPRAPRPPPARRAGTARGQEAADPRRRRRRARRRWHRAVGRGNRRRPGGGGVAAVPADPPTDQGGERPRRGARAARRGVGPARDRPRHPTPGQHGPQTLGAPRTEAAGARPGGERGEPGAPRHPAAAGRGHQGRPGPLRTPLAGAPEHRRPDGADGLARGAVAPPAGAATPADTGLRRGARPAPTAVPGRRVEARQAAGAEARAPACNQGRAGATPLQGGRCVSTIDGEGPVFAGPLGGCAQVSPLCHQVLDAEETQWGEHMESARPSCRAQGVTTKSDGRWHSLCHTPLQRADGRACEEPGG